MKSNVFHKKIQYSRQILTENFESELKKYAEFLQ